MSVSDAAGEAGPNDTAQRLRKLLAAEGACDVGFSAPEGAPGGFPVAVSVVVRLSDAIVDEIDGAPTYTYFSHYRAVNALIDRLLLRAGLLLQNEGFRYLTIAASQTVYHGGERTHEGRFSHKKAAVAAGLGTVGRSTLFLHRMYGPRVRLGTLFTDCPLPAPDGREMPMSDVCGGCDACVRACPAHAITGETWHRGLAREALLDAQKCNDYMRAHYMRIGRGAVCGICMRVCPRGVSPLRDFR